MKITHKQDVHINRDHDILCFFIENPEGILTRKATVHLPEETYYLYKPHFGIFEVLENELASYEGVHDLKSLRGILNDYQRLPLEYLAEAVYQESFCVSEIEECHEIKGIPWAIIQDCYKYAAMDKIGSVFLYVEEPFIHNIPDEIWSSDMKNTSLTKLIKTEELTLPEQEHWAKSLTKRPE